MRSIIGYRRWPNDYRSEPALEPPDDEPEFEPDPAQAEEYDEGDR